VFIIRWFIQVKVRKKQQELAVVSAMNKKLEQQVSDRTAHLNQAIEDLNENKKFMVQAEKMLSMGRLVTGIAHEVNTPLGVSITASSAIKEDVSFLKNKMQSNELSKSEFEKRLVNMVEFGGVLEGSLASAAKLINKFKKISINEVSDETQDCNIHSIIQDIKSVTTNEYVERTIDWKVHFDEGLVVQSSTYAIYTVLENLVSNAIKHGYSQQEVCEVIIDVSYLADVGQLKIVVQDKGKGIEKENVSKVFDPFYTSARSSDCVGLGLHIVYNEVTQRLGGTIECKSQIGSGTQITVLFPVKRIFPE